MGLTPEGSRCYCKPRGLPTHAGSPPRGLWESSQGAGVWLPDSAAERASLGASAGQVARRDFST